jgi:hypothetical protein
MFPVVEVDGMPKSKGVVAADGSPTSIQSSLLVGQIDPAFPIVYMTGAAADDCVGAGSCPIGAALFANDATTAVR